MALGNLKFDKDLIAELIKQPQKSQQVANLVPVPGTGGGVQVSPGMLEKFGPDFLKNLPNHQQVAVLAQLKQCQFFCFVGESTILFHFMFLTFSRHDVVNKSKCTHIL